MWNELLLYDQLVIDGKKEDLKTETPIAIVNIFDYNKFVRVLFLYKPLNLLFIAKKRFQSREQFSKVYNKLKQCLN